MTDVTGNFKEAHGPSATLAKAVQNLFAAAETDEPVVIDRVVGEFKTALAAVPAVEAYQVLSKVLEEIPYPVSEQVLKIAVESVENETDIPQGALKTLLLADMSDKFPGYSDQTEENPPLKTGKAYRQDVTDLLGTISVTPAVSILEALVPYVNSVSAASHETINRLALAKVEHYIQQLGQGRANDPVIADRLYKAAVASDGDRSVVYAGPDAGDILFDHVPYQTRLDIFEAKATAALDIAPDKDVTPFLQRFGQKPDDFFEADGATLKPAHHFVKPKDGETGSSGRLDLGSKPA